MKIALYLPGMLRQFELPYEYLKKYVLDPLDPDIFFSGYPNDDGLEYCKNKIEELYKPKKYILRNFDEEAKNEIYPNIQKYYSNKRPETRPETYISGRYNVKKCNDLRKSYEIENGFKYDVIICSRTDLFYNREHSSDELLRAKNGEVLIPHEWDCKYLNPIAVSDIGFVTNSENSNKISSIYDFIDTYFSEGNTLHPEIYMGIHLERMGILEKRTEINRYGWYHFYHPELGLDFDRKREVS